MAKYTTQIRTIVESGYPLFDFDYPIFDPKYKSVLEQKIIDWYYFREIGFETVGQFKQFLKARLNVVMPYYNDHYLALEVYKTYDPYINKDMKTTETRTNQQDLENKTDTTGNRTSDGTNSATITGSNTGRTVFSDTPQARLQGKDYATNLTELDDTNTNETSGTSKETDKTTGNATTTGKVTTTDEYIQTIKGFDGMKYAPEVYMSVRETIINIDQMVIDALNDLFMNIY